MPGILTPNGHSAPPSPRPGVRTVSRGLWITSIYSTEREYILSQRIALHECMQLLRSKILSLTSLTHNSAQLLRDSVAYGFFTSELASAIQLLGDCASVPESVRSSILRGRRGSPEVAPIPGLVVDAEKRRHLEDAQGIMRALKYVLDEDKVEYERLAESLNAL
ncbi:hypothetical protein EDD11_001688 [Mortierella claussenii]|nr:hypothetical protein EDD11_001688 [Mortierella claussenii]